MPLTSTRSGRVGPGRLVAGVLLSALVALLASVAAGSAAAADVPAGARTATGVTVAASLSLGAGTESPTPDRSSDYDGERGGPHQDTPEEQTGRAVSTARLWGIAVVLLVTVAVVVTLGVRARRRGRAGQGGRP